MMRELINDIIVKLSRQGVEDIYSAFDAKAVDHKGGGFFTVVGFNSFEASSPIYSPYTVYMPFKAEADIKVTAPKSSSMTELYDYYDSRISKTVEGMSGLTCRLSGMSVKFDSNIQRLVLDVRLAVSGVSRTERSPS